MTSMVRLWSCFRMDYTGFVILSFCSFSSLSWIGLLCHPFLSNFPYFLFSIGDYSWLTISLVLYVRFAFYELLYCIHALIRFLGKFVPLLPIKVCFYWTHLIERRRNLQIWIRMFAEWFRNGELHRKISFSSNRIQLPRLVHDKC